MAINREKYINKYIEECLENTSLAETLVFDIKDGVSVEDDLASLLRALHTLKGSSKMLEFRRIEELSHNLESVFIALREQRIGFSDDALKLILSSLDLLKSGFNVIKQTKNDGIDTENHIKNLALLASNEEFIIPALKAEDKDSHNSAPEDSVQDDSNSVQTKSEKAAQKQKTDTSAEKHRDLRAETIRISVDKINSIIKNIASLQTLEIIAKSISKESAALNAAVKDFAKAHREQPALSAELRKIERMAEKLNSAQKNYAINAGNHARSAYDSVISLRTLPVSTIFDNYPRYIFHLSQELGKKVHLSVEGSENEIDKNIIESMSEVFLHMARNAIDHGLELPQERTAAGKSETGNLSIICSRESGNMKIIISDDGRGIDLEKIRNKAVKDGLVAEAAAAGLSKEDLTNLIFRNGFSTSDNVSNISGRGVGLDVVRESIESLKGSIIVESRQGEGTSFTIMLPLSIASLTGFPVNCGKMKFIIPANFVDNIMLLNRSDIITVVDRPEIKYNNRIIKLFFLNQILQINEESHRTGEIIFVVIIRSYDDVAALAVDNIGSMRSVILKTMPSFMENLTVLSGIVINEDYEMVSVLHIPTVIKIAKRIKTIDIKKRNIDLEKRRKSILVVDDSPATREIECEILQSEGYIADKAADGAQALKAAKQKHYDLVCTDLNMPVMDGFMLIENFKKNEELSDIPIIVVSSIAVEEEKNRAFALGASRYIVKNSFNNHNLLDAVKDLIGGTI